MTFKTHNEALDSLPADAEWSSSFGGAGVGGYAAYYRTKAGDRYVVSNGTYNAIRPFTWTAEKVEHTKRNEGLLSFISQLPK